jgi:hypothetical protein
MNENKNVYNENGPETTFIKHIENSIDNQKFVALTVSLSISKVVALTTQTLSRAPSLVRWTLATPSPASRFSWVTLLTKTSKSNEKSPSLVWFPAPARPLSDAGGTDKAGFQCPLAALSGGSACSSRRVHPPVAYENFMPRKIKSLEQP